MTNLATVSMSPPQTLWKPNAHQRAVFQGQLSQTVALSLWSSTCKSLSSLRSQDCKRLALARKQQVLSQLSRHQEKSVQKLEASKLESLIAVLIKTLDNLLAIRKCRHSQTWAICSSIMAKTSIQLVKPWWHSRMVQTSKFPPFSLWSTRMDRASSSALMSTTTALRLLMQTTMATKHLSSPCLATKIIQVTTSSFRCRITTQLSTWMAATDTIVLSTSLLTNRLAVSTTPRSSGPSLTNFSQSLGDLSLCTLKHSQARSKATTVPMVLSIYETTRIVLIWVTCSSIVDNCQHQRRAPPSLR